MDNKKTDQYYIDKIITDLTFIRTHTESLSKSKLEEDEILVDSIVPKRNGNVNSECA